VSTVVVTGSTKGVGFALANEFASRGWSVLISGRTMPGIEDALNRIRERTPNAQVAGAIVDVSSFASVQALWATAVAQFGPIDLWINNAGLALGREKVEASSLTDWEQMITTNITANFRMVHLVLPWMLEQKRGDIINLCSVAGHYTYQGGAVYCATKHAVKAFTRVLREETCGKNIRVMQISPGMVNTEFSTVRFKGNKDSADAVYSNMSPLLAEDIARMMTFMLEQPRHVVIDEIITMPQDQGSPTTIHRHTI
jgi:NADP-dependent 3-hydroxy acid dehydrogenase YdfG